METKLFNCKIYISFSLIFVITLFSIIDKSNITLLGFLATACHEFGHILAMLISGHKIKEISLNLFNFNIVDYKRNENGFLCNIFVLSAGFAFNVIVALASLAIFKFSLCATAAYFAVENLFLAIINILPIASLDGGQIFCLILTNTRGEIFAQRALNITSFLLVLPIAALGLFILFSSRYNFSLLWICVYLIALILLKKDTCF